MQSDQTPYSSGFQKEKEKEKKLSLDIIRGRLARVVTARPKSPGNARPQRRVLRGLLRAGRGPAGLRPGRVRGLFPRCARLSLAEPQKFRGVGLAAISPSET